MNHSADASLAEKGELPPLYTGTGDMALADKSEPPPYSACFSECNCAQRECEDEGEQQSEWLGGKPWKYRTILAANVLLIIGGQHAYLW